MLHLFSININKAGGWRQWGWEDRINVVDWGLGVACFGY